MSVNKSGSPLTPYLKSSSIFEGHPNANLASVGTVGIVHSGNLQIGVYSTVYEAYAAGVSLGQMYALGKEHDTGLIEADGGAPEPENPEMEHSMEVVEVLEKEIPEGEVSIAATPVVLAQGCELVIYEIRILTPYELRLCEQKSLINTIVGQAADAVFNKDNLEVRIEELGVERDAIKEEKDAKDTTKNNLQEQESTLREEYETLTSGCAKESAEAGAGQSGACEELAKFIAAGSVNRIANLRAQITELVLEIAVLDAEDQRLYELSEELKSEKDLLQKQASILADAAEAEQANLTKAEDTYANLGSSIAPSIGQMNSLAVGKTTIAGCGDEQECCPLPDGPGGEVALFNLNFLSKYMAEGGGAEEPKEG